MKKCKRISACLLAVLCLLCALAMPAGAEGFEYGWDQDSNNPNGPHCKAYFMLNLDTHTAVYSNNADEQLPMASLTKIMSYIVAYETIPDIENAQITIPQSVVDELAGTGSSVAEFNVGETFTGLDLLYLMMVPSGNNARLDLGQVRGPALRRGEAQRHFYLRYRLHYQREFFSADSASSAASAGSSSEGTTDDPEAATASQSALDTTTVAPAYGEEGFDGSDYTGRSYFVQLMNQKAQELGCTNTHFTNPHGLHNENHYSSARDMITITEYAMSLPHFTEITSTTAYNYHPVGDEENVRTANTTNRMLTNMVYSDGMSYYYAYATGIKTGSHDQAGYCIVASATYGGYTYIVACLGSPSVDSNVHGEMLDAASLFRWAFLNLSSKTITSQGDILADVPLDYAWQKDTLQLAAGENVSVMLPNSVDTSSIIVETDLPESVQAPIEKGEQVGTATMSYAGEVIATVPLVAAESVSRSEMLSFISQSGSVLTSPGSSSSWGLFCC